MTIPAALRILLSAGIVVPLLALQGPGEIALRPADAQLAAPFTRIHSIRELADGRVLISDNSVDTRLVVADLHSGAVRTIGRQGAGPAEYRVAGTLLRLPADSTLLVEGARGRRWLILAGDSIVATLPPDLPAIKAVPGDLSGADTNGRVLGIRWHSSDQLSGDMSRQRLAVIVADRSSARSDTILMLKGMSQSVRVTGTRENPLYTFAVHLGSANEQALLFRDGWIAVVHVEPFRVDWRSPSGAMSQGPDLGWTAPRSDERMRRAFLERRRIRDPGARMPDLPWSDRLAPIRPNSLNGTPPLLGTPQGELLVMRSQWLQTGNENRYDVIDRKGQLSARLVLPDSERVVGFGQRSVYVSIADEDGFERLRRHPWP